MPEGSALPGRPRGEGGKQEPETKVALSDSEGRFFPEAENAERVLT